jgi:ubiquitin-conjugating enzyme E2 N
VVGMILSLGNDILAHVLVALGTADICVTVRALCYLSRTASRFRVQVFLNDDDGGEGTGAKMLSMVEHAAKLIVLQWYEKHNWQLPTMRATAWQGELCLRSLLSHFHGGWAASILIQRARCRRVALLERIRSGSANRPLKTRLCKEMDQAWDGESRDNRLDYWSPQQSQWCRPRGIASNGCSGTTSILYCEPVGTNLWLWRAAMMGPMGSPYSGGIFHVDIMIPEDYPMHSPEFHFRTKVYHPNITELGRVCLSDDNWSPAVRILTQLISIQALLAPATLEVTPDHTGQQPTCNGVGAQGNPAAAAAFAEDPLGTFASTAREWTQRYAVGHI